MKRQLPTTPHQEPVVAGNSGKKIRVEESEGELINYAQLTARSSSPVRIFFTDVLPMLKKSYVRKGNDLDCLDDLILVEDHIADNVAEVKQVVKVAIEQFEPTKDFIKNELESLVALKDEDLNTFIRNGRTKVYTDDKKKKYKWEHSDQALLNEIAHCQNMIRAANAILKGRSMGTDLAVLKHMDDNLEILFKKDEVVAPESQDYRNCWG
jgi:hypothetical protein